MPSVQSDSEVRQEPPGGLVVQVLHQPEVVAEEVVVAADGLQADRQDQDGNRAHDRDAVHVDVAATCPTGAHSSAGVSLGGFLHRAFHNKDPTASQLAEWRNCLESTMNTMYPERRRR